MVNTTHEHFFARQQWLHKTPVGWTLMAHEKRGKMVCRYFYPTGGGSHG